MWEVAKLYGISGSLGRGCAGILVAGLMAFGVASTAFAQTTWAELGPSAGSDPLGLSLDHATIGVADPEKEANWYQQALGFKRGELHHAPTFDVQTMLLPGVRLDLAHQAGSTRPTPRMGFDKQGLLHLAIRSTDPEAVLKRLTEMGADVVANRNKAGKLNVILVHDPEGNNLEIMPK